jgi:hypothetical protein
MLEEGHRYTVSDIQGVVIKSSFSQLMDFQNPSSDELHTF